MGIAEIDKTPGVLEEAAFDRGSYIREARRQASEEIRKAVENKFWKSEDICTATDVLLKPQQKVHVPILMPEDLGPLAPSFPWSMHSAYATTRSRFAQVGLEVDRLAPEYIAINAYPQNPDWDGLRLAYVPVSNRGERSIYLPEDTGFFYLYSFNSKPIKGEKLMQMIGSDIAIDGQEGKDWRFWYLGTERTIENLEGVELIIDPNSIGVIPFDHEPINLYSGNCENHNRDGVDAYLSKAVPVTDKPILTISETTAALRLNGKVNGLVEAGISHDGHRIGLTESHGIHLNSIYIDGENTDGPIRTEIVAPTSPTLSPQTIAIRFFPR